MRIALRHSSRNRVRTVFFLCVALTPGVWASALIANTACESVESSTPSRILSQAETQKLQVEWKRAIDQDKGSELWRLLAEVDANRVDVKLTNDKGKTALMAAVKIGDQCLLAELLQRGLKISDKGYTGGTTLMYAVLGNNSGMVDTVLAQKPALNAQSTNGWTAVMIAAAKGFKGSMQQLFTAGADINLPDVYLWTPLMRAIENRHSSVVSYLLTLPAIEVRQTNENGSTALHIAAQTGDQKTVATLMALGSEATAADKNGFTASDVAMKNGYPDIAKLIKQ